MATTRLSIFGVVGRPYAAWQPKGPAPIAPDLPETRFQLKYQYQFVTFVSDGTNYHIIAESTGSWL